MLREFKFFRRNSGKNPTTDANNENLPLEQSVSSASQQDADPSRLPFSAIQEPERNPRSGLDQETHLRRKSEKTPSKSQAKGSDQFFQSRTPDKLPASKGRFGWVPIVEQAGLTSPERREYSLHQGQFQLPPPPPLMANHALNFGNGYSAATPRSIATGGRASSVHSGTSSTQSTPTKSVSKPMINGFSNSRAPQCGGTAKAMNFSVSSKGVPLSSAPPPVYASVEVPHFELKEDPSFWMDHNVQVVIRVRPINIIESSQQGYSRCIKQESAQSITWIGQSESRFMFDYIACETINQEMLFRVAGLPMVENCMSGYNSCVFAYGQTGSGKTHTMLGEINNLEIGPSTNRGMIPRIFEFLFARIKAEEESRRDEKLKYTCKCSFLEIYNEQISDLLNPTSTNLLIREDPRKGVHVENLSEFEVENVYDTLQLLIQGAASRKVAATMMNRESSRSHSVFTCTIESRWQKDSTSTLRFARLNLVDLAGSERQKTSGAEGDRLKEASNINKSLSTLGHVIMVLADLANGRQRHVPYRDSRLTFLLQDSLGGNSKTMIIANVSPSICSTNETLSTLKFAQRAKVIQNNAVVNENASGDVFALQHQIHLLKEELSMLKQQNISRSLSFRTTTLENVDYDAYSPQKLPGILSEFKQIPNSEELQDVRVLNMQLKSFEASLAGAFRREKKAAIAMRQLEAEIEQLNRLVRQREEDSQCSKMMIKFREDKIYRMEALLNGLIPSESYLREENNALSEEIKLLRTKIDRNPEVTRFASENIRLLEELRKFQDFYDEGERGLLLTELSVLRNQLAQFLDGKLKSDINAQDLCLASPEKVPCSCSTKHVEEVLNLEQELDRLKTIIAIEKSSRVEAEKRAILSETELSITNDKLLRISKRYDATTDKLKDTRSVIEALESQQMLSINELEVLRENNIRLADTVKIQEQQISTMKKQLALRIDVGNRKSIITHEILREDYSESECSSPFQDKLKRVQASLEKAWNLNMRYQSDQASHSSSEREMDEVRRQVEAETAEVIVCLQEELTTVNQIVDKCNKNELLVKQRLMDLEKEKKEQDDKLYLLTLENIRLAKLTEEKEQNASSIMEHWEQLAIEISDLLENGKAQLDNATHEAASISDICSHKSWITEQFGKIIMGISKRDSLIEELQENLEAACYVRHDVESKLMTLRGAILAITEAQQQENSDKESRILHLTSLLAEKTSIISELEDKVEDAVRKVRKAEICAAIFFIIVKKLYEINKIHLQALDEANLQLRESESIIPQKDDIIQGHASLLSIEGKGFQDHRAQVEQNYQQANSLEHWKDGYLDTSSKNEEGNITTPDSSCSLVEAKMKLREFQMQMSTLKSCLHEYANNQSNIGSSQDTHTDEQKNAESMQCMIENYSSKKMNKSYKQFPEDILEREETIEILRKEIESALQSLKEVQCQMAEMFAEKEGIKKSMLHSHNSIKGLTAEVHRLNSEILNKEKEFEFKLLQLEEKLQTFEGNSVAFNCLWRKEKEELELEISEMKAVAAHKTIETSNILLKIEAAQQAQQEANVMVNALMEANKTANLEIDRLKKTEISLCLECCYLTGELHNLQTSLDEKDKNLEYIQNNLKSNFTEAMDLVIAVEDQFMSLKNAFIESFTLIKHDLDGLKFWIPQHIDSRMWLEEICLGIIGKETAVSVSHLCHVGFLLERITGLNGEIRFLQNGLSESNSLVTRLREQNIKAKKELNICNVLKGKLLFDINNCFSRITDKENEISEFSAKLNSFEEKIVGLQFIEETMLERSNSICHELDVLRDKLNAANKDNALRAAVQEKLMKDNAEANERLEELSLLLNKVQVTNKTLRDELDMEFNEKVMVDEKFGMELFNLNNLLDQKRHLLEDLQKEMYCIRYEKDKLESNLSTLTEKLILVEVNKSIAAEQVENQSMENEELKLRLMEMSKVLDQKKQLYEDLQKEICCFKHENDKLESHVSTLTEKLILVEENKAIAAEQLENQLMENEELKLRLMGLEELRSKYVVCKESNNMKTIAMERLKKDLLDASILIGQRDVLVEELQKDMSRIAHEKDEFESEAYTLKEKLILVEENKFIVAEQLENQLMENEELKLRLMEMSMGLEELQRKYEVVCKESNNVKTIALERLKKEMLDASILIGQRDVLVEELQKDISRISHEKEKFEFEAYTLKEKLKLAKSIAEKNEAVETESPQRKLLMENEQLKLQLEHMTRMLHEVKTLNRNLQEELEDKMSSAVLQKKLHDSLSERSNVFEEFQNEMTVITHSKEQLESQVSILKEKLKMAESLAVVNKVVAIEARQIAEERRSYAQVKEEEVKLLERSIEELECTVNALQEQVKIVKGEAERQRIQRNELEMEEEAKRQLKENLSELENAQNSIQLLRKEATERELELVQCRSIISELNLHAEAQASEYNRKFKELEAMAFQLKTELVTSNTANPTSTKSEKGAAKSRGSGSPFKCIVGLAQQINTEKDEELTVARCKIEELEALAASRQNQIFMLNIRLAAAESMTHDVLRDLLGIKLDMTKYAKMNGGSHSDDSMKEKDKELAELKRKVDEFVEERKSLLEKINRRHEELIAAQIRLGKLEENEEFLSTENELLKADNAKYKNIVMELEEELEKISIQLNMQ